jgi:hypothetical protein
MTTKRPNPPKKADKDRTEELERISKRPVSDKQVIDYQQQQGVRQPKQE